MLNIRLLHSPILFFNSHAWYHHSLCVHSEEISSSLTTTPCIEVVQKVLKDFLGKTLCHMNKPNLKKNFSAINLIRYKMTERTKHCISDFLKIDLVYALYVFIQFSFFISNNNLIFFDMLLNMSNRVNSLFLLFQFKKMLMFNKPSMIL